MSSGSSNRSSDSSPKPHSSLANRMLVRPARPDDYPSVIELLTALELDYPSRDLTRFLVGELDGEIRAIAELKDYTGFYLLSCVGVKEDLQGTGLGRFFVNRVLRDVHKDVYLYTLVPDFFKKAGFVEASSLPAGLPPRLIYGCASCDPAYCRCLVRKPDASTVPEV